MKLGFTVSDVEAILYAFREKEGFESYGHVSNELIHDMESALNISFPVQYKSFLKKFGYIEWFGHAIFGYSNDEDYDTVSTTIQLRHG